MHFAHKWELFAFFLLWQKWRQKQSRNLPAMKTCTTWRGRVISFWVRLFCFISGTIEVHRWSSWIKYLPMVHLVKRLKSELMSIILTPVMLSPIYCKGAMKTFNNCHIQTSESGCCITWESQYYPERLMWTTTNHITKTNITIFVQLGRFMLNRMVEWSTQIVIQIVRKLYKNKRSCKIYLVKSKSTSKAHGSTSLWI